MNCKFCSTELEEGVTLCPVCGKENKEPDDVITEQEKPETEMIEPEMTEMEGEPYTAEVPEEAIPEQPAEKTKKKGFRTAVAIVCCVALLGGLAGVILHSLGVFTPKEEQNATVKASYTVEDEKVLADADKVIARVGDKELTNGELQIYYWGQVIDFLNYNGVYYFDYTAPLDEQYFSEEDSVTWEQYFLEIAIETWRRYATMSLLAEEEGFELSQEQKTNLEQLPDALKETADSYGYENADKWIQYNFGPGVTAAAYISYMNIYCEGLEYFNSRYEALAPTKEEVEAYFAANEETFTASGITKDSGDLADVRHILVIPEGGTENEDGTVVYSEDEYEACLKEAQAILDQWLAGDATEESFAELASIYTEDTSSASVGGLYSQVYPGQMVEEFDAWLFDESHEYGDYGLVKTKFGYHIMFFVSCAPEWEITAETNLLTERASELVESGLSRWDIEINYEDISLGYLNLAG